MLVAPLLAVSPVTAQESPDSIELLEAALLEVASTVRDGGPVVIDLDPLVKVAEPGESINPSPSTREAKSSHRADLEDSMGEFDGVIHQVGEEHTFGEPGSYLLTVFDTADGSARSSYLVELSRSGYKIGKPVVERERPADTTTLGGGSSTARTTVGICEMHTYRPLLAGGVTVLAQGRIDNCTQSATVFVDTRLHVWSSVQSMWSITDVEWGSGENLATADATTPCVQISQNRTWRTRVAGTAIFHPAGFDSATRHRYKSLACI